MQDSNNQHQESKSRFAVLLMIMLASISCLWCCTDDGPGPEPSPVGIYCKVVDSLTGVGISGAWAAFVEDTSEVKRQYTDTQGDIRLAAPRGSTSTFCFGAAGYTAKTLLFENVTAEITGVVIELAQ